MRCVASCMGRSLPRAGALPNRAPGRGRPGDDRAVSVSRRRPEDFLEIVERAKRGRLKIYIGPAAGVGKTYRMLEEAHAMQRRGVDVVLGLIETHGRADTAALLEGLELVPRRTI